MCLLNTYRGHFKGFKSDYARERYLNNRHGKNKLENGGVKLESEQLTFFLVCSRGNLLSSAPWNKSNKERRRRTETTRKRRSLNLGSMSGANTFEIV